MDYKYLDAFINKDDWTDEDELIVANLSEPERTYLAQKLISYDAILINFSFDKSENVRLAVAENEYTPKMVLERLMENDTSLIVRKAAQRNLRG